MGSIPSGKSCWVTLVTKPSYLPGAIILAHTLDKHSSKYPFVVLYTSSLGEHGVKVLRAEAKAKGRIIPEQVELVLPRKDQENKGSVAERFKDTFTKLRAFEVFKFGYSRAVFLDADMAIFRNPDDLMDSRLPSGDWLGANHACVCNLDHDPWASSDWHKGNCAFTPLTGPDQVAPSSSSTTRPTYQLLNGGMFLFHPTQDLWDRMLHFFNTTDRLKTYQFPDQDFMADFFKDKWLPLSWKYNALKTMRYWHPRMWSDDEVVILHYIVDKPWERQVSKDGVAGHLGRDGVTHQWWWDIYHDWETEKKASSDDQLVLKGISKLINTEEPFTEMTPLPQAPGKPEDVQSYP